MMVPVGLCHDFVAWTLASKVANIFYFDPYVYSGI